MKISIPAAGQERFARAVAPIAGTTAFAVATNLGIRSEAITRWMLEQELDVLTRSTGLRTARQKGRRRELEAAGELRAAAGSDTNGAERTGGRRVQHPAVNWHEGGAGEPLLLLNGWNASGLTWPTAWLIRLEEQFRVIRVDNRGSGWSRYAPTPYTLSTLADDALDVLLACGIESAVTLGLSMGGMIAQEFALRHPKAVSRLILVGTRPPTPAQVPSDPVALLAAMRPLEPGQVREAYFEQMWRAFAAPGFAEREPETMHDLVASIVMRTTPRATVLNQARAMASWYGPDRLRHLRLPTTVVHGTRDPLMPVGNGMRLANLIPTATYVELPAVGHLVPYEDPQSLLDVLLS